MIEYQVDISKGYLIDLKINERSVIIVITNL